MKIDKGKIAKGRKVLRSMGIVVIHLTDAHVITLLVQHGYWYNAALEQWQKGW